MKICWSDEATFELGYDSRGFYITRAPGEEFLERNLKPSFKSGRTAVSVWGCFMGREKGPLVVLEKGARMNQHRYTEEILKPHFVPFYERMQELYGTDSSPVYLQEDGARYHTAGVPARYRLSMRVNQLPWPAQSPDLAPIENLWKIQKDEVSKRRHRIKSVEEMGITLVEEWEEMEADLLEKLARSLIKRMALCIKAKGGSIKY
jgi:hypothetical protein